MVEALFTPSISQQYSVCFFISGRSHADIYKFKNHKKKNGVMLYEKKGARWQTSQPVAGAALDMSVCILLDPQEQGTSQYPPKNQLSWPCFVIWVQEVPLRSPLPRSQWNTNRYFKSFIPLAIRSLNSDTLRLTSLYDRWWTHFYFCLWLHEQVVAKLQMNCQNQ